MIKDIEQASKSFSFTNNLVLTEKMNMFYFKVVVTPISCNIISHNHKMITDVERIINDVWEDVISFVNKEIEPRKEYITSKYGNVVIGFFYCPVDKPLSIQYDKFLNTNIDNNKFIISNIKKINTKEFIDVSDFCLSTRLLNIRGIGGGPIIIYPNDFIYVLNDYIHKYISKNDLLKYINDNMETFSGNELNDIEGLIFCEKDKKYQLIINNTLDKREYDREQYELIIKDFIDFWYNKKDRVYYINGNYTDILNDIFIDYIKKTNIFNDNNLQSERLLPPGKRYIGDLNYKLINNDNIKTICKVNDVYKNVYRILYKALKQHKKINNHLVILNDSDIAKWDKIIDDLWYKKSEK